MSDEYVHQELHQEVTAIGGHYVLTDEVRLPFDGRELLYVVGYGVVDTSCCGIAGCVYALVPGFVLEWRVKTNGAGLPVSRVEPVREERLRARIRRAIKSREVVHQVRFD